MRAIQHLTIITAAIITTLAATPIASAEALSRLSSRFLTRGEQALLEVCISGATPSSTPQIPNIPGVQITATNRGAQTRLLPGRKLEYVFEFMVTSYEIGNFTIPSIEMNAGGIRSKTEPLEFSVFNPDELKWSEAIIGGRSVRYASAFKVMNNQPYDGETIPIEIKLFVPRDLFVEDWGIPDFTRDGLTCWRFQPSQMRGNVNLLGVPCVSVAYPSTLTATRSGSIGIGPASIRLVTTQMVLDGYPRRVNLETNVSVPELRLNARPLPPNAPQGFENAVGNFNISATVSQTEVTEGDPIPVEIIVSGSGNLDTVRPPKLIDPLGWKIYDASPSLRGDERRELSGQTVFQQFMRPLELKSALPGFKLVYFDPKKQSYETVTTAPTPLQMKPAPQNTQAPALGTPPTAANTPVERMTDILGIIDSPNTVQASGEKFPNWLLHAIAGFVAAILAIKAIAMRLRLRHPHDPAKKQRHKELKELERMKTGDRISFLLAAGHFIERQLGNQHTPELQAILAERDAECFKPKPPSTPIDRSQRDSILKTLRKAALASLALAMLGATPRADAADIAKTAYETARYSEAAKLWIESAPYESLTPDVLYNIGNACYRGNSPGNAALYYRRALNLDPHHAEARQNLRFIERKYGSITINRPAFQTTLARISIDTWKNLLWASLWISTLSLLTITATKRSSSARYFATVGLILGPMLAFCATFAWRAYPKDGEFAKDKLQAVVIHENATLHSEASRTSPEVIDAPPGSLCTILHQSGRWSYVGFATKTRGWIPTDMIEKILPDSPPKAPEFRKPKANDKSA
jgi:tetratricopeptide (TPR) repeat protein